MRPIFFARDREGAVLRWIRLPLAAACAAALLGAATAWMSATPDGLTSWVLLAAIGSQGTALLLALVLPRPSAGEGVALDLAGLTVVADGQRRTLPWASLRDALIAGRSAPLRMVFGPCIVLRMPGGPPLLSIAGDFLDPQGEMVAALRRARDAGAGRAGHEDGAAESFHAADEDKRKTAILVTLVGGLIGPIVVFAAGAAVTLFREGWDSFGAIWLAPGSRPVLLSFAVGCLVFDAWKLFHRHGPRSNRLRLDADGLTLAAEGRSRRWLWSEIAVPALFEEPDPDGGTPTTFVAFTARQDGFSPGRVPPSGALLPAAPRCRIDDRYSAPPAEIAEAIDRWRLAAAGAEPSPASAELPHAGLVPSR